MKLQVGQKLWFVPSQSCFGRPREVTIIKVGRKWATAESLHQKINVDTLKAGEDVFYGACHVSRERYEETAGMENDWRDIIQTFSRCYTKPSYLTRADLDDRKRILRVEEKRNENA